LAAPAGAGLEFGVGTGRFWDGKIVIRIYRLVFPAHYEREGIFEETFLTAEILLRFPSFP
jgi:hypothetical protein